MNTAILNNRVQEYIWEHQDISPAAIALQKSPFGHVSSSELATQIDGLQRTKRKIPLWSLKKGIYFPNKLNLEQCSSQETALFKASLIQKNAQIIDLTGGFGVDSFFLANNAKNLIHCELDAKLSSIVSYNMKQLGQNNITCMAGDGISYLNKSAPIFDVIYLDPSRRVQQKKVFRLADCEPDILKLQELFFSKSKVVMTKLAPLLDIHAALLDLPYVSDVYTISLNNDCKELLFIQRKDYVHYPQIHAVQLAANENKVFTFNYKEEKEAKPTYEVPQDFLYDPDVALTKAGAFKSIATRYNLAKLHISTHLYTSVQLCKDFPGRRFTILKTIPLSSFKKQNKIKQANVIIKNFPLKVDEVKKKYKLTDGGDTYLFFTKQHNDQYIVIVAERI